MNLIVKKAGMSLISGAACMLGSWLTKEILDATKKGVINLTKEEENNEKEGSV